MVSRPRAMLSPTVEVPRLTGTPTEALNKLVCDGCRASVSVVTVVAGALTLLAKADPLRTRIGFSTLQAAILTPNDGLIVTPFGEVVSGAGFGLGNIGLIWLTDADAAQFTMFDWYGYNRALVDRVVTVYELIDMR